MALSQSALSGLLDEESKEREHRAKLAAKMAVLKTQLAGFGNCSVADVQKATPTCGGK